MKYEIHASLNDDTCVRIDLAGSGTVGHSSWICQPGWGTIILRYRRVHGPTHFPNRFQFGRRTEDENSQPLPPNFFHSAPRYSNLRYVRGPSLLRDASVGVCCFRRGGRSEMINKPRYRPVLVSWTVRPIDSNPQLPSVRGILGGTAGERVRLGESGMGDDDEATTTRLYRRCIVHRARFTRDCARGAMASDKSVIKMSRPP